MHHATVAPEHMWKATQEPPSKIYSRWTQPWVAGAPGLRLHAPAPGACDEACFHRRADSHINFVRYRKHPTCECPESSRHTSACTLSKLPAPRHPQGGGIMRKLASVGPPLHDPPR